MWRAEPVEDELAPGEVAAEGGRLAVGFADGALEIVDVQPAGKRTMTAGELLRGRRGPVGPATRAADVSARLAALSVLGRVEEGGA